MAPTSTIHKLRNSSNLRPFNFHSPSKISTNHHPVINQSLPLYSLTNTKNFAVLLPKQKPIYKRLWFWAFLSILILSAVLILLLFTMRNSVFSTNLLKKSFNFNSQNLNLQNYQVKSVQNYQITSQISSETSGNQEKKSVHKFQSVNQSEDEKKSQNSVIDKKVAEGMTNKQGQKNEIKQKKEGKGQQFLQKSRTKEIWQVIEQVSTEHKQKLVASTNKQESKKKSHRLRLDDIKMRKNL